MKNQNRVALFVMTKKGFAVFKKILEKFGRDTIECVVTAKDGGLTDDHSSQICKLAEQCGIPLFHRHDHLPALECTKIAVSWRWMIPQDGAFPVIVFHDSRLPRYRGFSPLVSAMINGDQSIGVTALIASDEYDKGPIVAQQSTRIEYPITIAQAIDEIIPCYECLAGEVIAKVLANKLTSEPQDEGQATYSLWRDEEDYRIDWKAPAAAIRRFVDAVGDPYLGASCRIESNMCRVIECEEVDDVKIENRTPGKVIFIRGGYPEVACGKGILRIKKLLCSQTGTSLLPLSKFRTRFF
jgi:methionyl-tRNA formyltransferase